MDSLTHLALGACMGEALTGKKLGKKAMLWGAALQSLPDIDFIAALWMDPASNLLAHRGFTHSILFCLIISPFVALLAERLHRPHNISLVKWMLFVATLVLTHILIDAFNAYGVGWFEPFSHQRISFNALYVVDPLFSVWPGLSCLALLLIKRGKPVRRAWWGLGLGMSLLYLITAVAIKIQTDKKVTNILHDQHIRYTRYFTTPAPLQNFLWFVVAGNNEGYYTGYYSILAKEKKIDFEYFPRNDSLLNPIRDHMQIQQLMRFSKGFYIMTQTADTLVFNDLRFGQISGWYKPRNDFVFRYYLTHRSDNRMVLQKGRFADWNWQSAAELKRKIKGN